MSMPESEGLLWPGVPARNAAQAKEKAEQAARKPSPWAQMDSGMRCLMRSILGEWICSLEQFRPMQVAEYERMEEFLFTALMQFEKQRAMHIKDMEEQIRKFVNVTPPSASSPLTVRYCPYCLKDVPLHSPSTVCRRPECQAKQAEASAILRRNF